MNCLHSANTNTLPLIKFSGNEDKIEDTKNLVRHVVKCIQNRQMRHTEHLLTRAALSDTATKTTEKVMEEITEQIRDGQMEDIRQFLEQGEPYGKDHVVFRLPDPFIIMRTSVFGNNCQRRYKPSHGRQCSPNPPDVAKVRAHIMMRTLIHRNTWPAFPLTHPSCRERARW